MSPTGSGPKSKDVTNSPFGPCSSTDTSFQVPTSLSRAVPCVLAGAGAGAPGAFSAVLVGEDTKQIAAAASTANSHLGGGSRGLFMIVSVVTALTPHRRGRDRASGTRQSYHTGADVSLQPSAASAEQTMSSSADPQLTRV